MKRIKTIIFLCFAATMAFIAFSGCQRSLVVDFEPLTAPYSDVSLTTETQNSLPLLDRDLPLLTGRTSPSPGTTIPPATGERSDSSTTTEEIILTTKTKPTTTTSTNITTTSSASIKVSDRQSKHSWDVKSTTCRRRPIVSARAWTSTSTAIYSTDSSRRRPPCSRDLLSAYYVCLNWTSR
jgi:hypothetical protein